MVLIPRIRGYWFPSHLQSTLKYRENISIHDEDNLDKELYCFNHTQVASVPENLVYFLNRDELAVFANHYQGIAEAPNAEIRSRTYTNLAGVEAPNLELSLVWIGKRPPQDDEQILIDYGYELYPDAPHDAPPSDVPPSDVPGPADLDNDSDCQPVLKKKKRKSTSSAPITSPSGSVKKKKKDKDSSSSSSNDNAEPPSPPPPKAKSPKKAKRRIKKKSKQASADDEDTE